MRARPNLRKPALHFWQHAAAGEAALPDGWKEVPVDGGESYYFHKESGTTQWTRP